MFTVIVTEKGGEQQRHDSDKPEVTIGRVQGNDIILPKGNVSKRHARIVLKDGKFIVVDLKSTNGTYVNGRKIQSPLVIKESDKVYIGDFILTVEDEGEVSVTASPPSSSPAPEPERLAPPPAQIVHAPAPVPPASSAPVFAPPAPPSAGHSPAPAPPAPPAPRRAPPPLAAAAPVSSRIDAAQRREEKPEPQPQPQVEPQAAEPVEARPTVPRQVVVPPAAVPPGPTATTIGHEPAAPLRGAPMPRDPLAARAASVGAKDLALRESVPRPASSAEPARKEDRDRPAPDRIRSGPVGSGAAAPAVAPVPVPAPPVLKDARLAELRREICERVAAELELERIPVEKQSEEPLWQRAEGAVCDLVEQLDRDGAIPSDLDQAALIKEALNEMLGLGPLEELLADDEITQIFVDRPDLVLVERKGQKDARTPSDRAFSSEVSLQRIIERLVASSGRKLDAAQPFVSARLRDGVQLSATLPPVAVRGPCLTLRKPGRQRLMLEDLVRGGALSQAMAEFLGICILARKNLLVCGSAGAGKTTLIGALLAHVPAQERIVSVEEATELALARERWACFESVGSDGSQVEPLRAALKMRPDRLVVGDVTGREAFELVTYMAAQEGSLAALTAEGPAAALTRLLTLARLGAGDGHGTASAGLRGLCASAVNVVVHVARYGDGVRRVATVSEVGVEADGDTSVIRDLFQFQTQNRAPDGALRGRFVGLGVVPRFYEALEARGVTANPGVFK